MKCRVLTGAWVAVLVFSVAVPGAVARRPPRQQSIPKGTPYAAEVRVNIHGDVQVSRTFTQTIKQACPSGDAILPQNRGLDTSFVLSWDARFNYVTVPVAGISQLGDSYETLHVPIKPTSQGDQGRLTGGGYVKGYGPSDYGSNDPETGCNRQEFTWPVELIRDPHRSPFFIPAMFGTGDLGAGPAKRYVLYMGDMPNPDPDVVQDSQGAPISVNDQMALALDAIPRQTLTLTEPYAGPNYVIADWPVRRLRPLVTRDTVNMPEIRRSGTKDCGTVNDAFEDTSCESEYLINYKTTLTVRCLHLTHKRYPKSALRVVPSHDPCPPKKG